MTVGKKLKEFRKGAKLNQTVFAEKAGISRTYLSDVENDRYNPSIPFLKKVSNALAGAGGRILINDTFYENNSEAMYNIIYNSLMEHAGYIDENTYVLKTKEDVNKIKSLLYDYQRRNNEISKEIKELKEEEPDLDELDEEEENQRRLANLESELKTLNQEINTQIKELELLENDYENLDSIKIYEEAKQIQNTIESFTGKANDVLELENLFNMTQEITINGKSLSDDEKQKALQILKLTFDK